jgi:hypothetical protein
MSQKNSFTRLFASSCDEALLNDIWLSSGGDVTKAVAIAKEMGFVQQEQHQQSHTTSVDSDQSPQPQTNAWVWDDTFASDTIEVQDNVIHFAPVTSSRAPYMPPVLGKTAFDRGTGHTIQSDVTAL